MTSLNDTGPFESKQAKILWVLAQDVNHDIEERVNLQDLEESYDVLL